MTSLQQWCAVLFVLVIVCWIASLVYLLVSKNPQKWIYWAGSFAAFVVVSFIILTIIYPEKQQASQAEIYKTIVEQAKNNPVCTTEREVCIRREMDTKRENDVLLRGDLRELEEKLVHDPKNKKLIATIKLKKDSLANDIQKLDNCKFEKATNRCIDHVLDVCETMMREKDDSVLYKQFQDFRNTKDPSEVLNLCNSVANSL